MTKLQKWLLGSLIILLIIGITLTVLRPTEESNPIRAAVPLGPASATFYIAMEENLFSRESPQIQVKYQPFSSGRLALDALFGGSVDLAFVAETPLVLAALNSKDFRILAVVSQSPHKFVRRKANKNLGTKKDIPKYGVPVGTAAQYWMDRYLSSTGMNQNVRTLNIDAQNLATALVNESIDGFFCWEPFASIAITQFRDNELDVIDSGGLYTQFFALVALTDTIQRDKKRLETFINSLYKASRQITDNRKNTVIPIVAQYSEMRVQDLERIWDDYDFSISLPPNLLETMNSEANWAINSGITPELKLDFSNFLDTSLHKAVCPDCVEYPLSVRKTKQTE